MKPEPEWIKSSGGFMMTRTVSILILISVPNAEQQEWSNVVFLQDFRVLTCVTVGLSAGIKRISSIQSAVSIFSVNSPELIKIILSRNGYLHL